MARTKQLPHHDIAAATNAITLSDESESGDDIVVETAPPKGTQQVKGKKNAVAVDTTKKAATNQTIKTMNAAVKNAKGKGKAKVDAEADDQDMDVDIENLTGKKWLDHALVGPPSRDINVLKRDNEMLEEENQRLQQALDDVLEAVKPGVREEEMQAEIETLNELIKRDYFSIYTKDTIKTVSKASSHRQQRLLELRNSEYTKSRLINHDPAEPADWVTLDWAENLRDKAVAELKGQMEKLAVRVEKAEKGRKDAEREGAEARRQLATVQRELDAEVAHSKQLAAEIGRRPATAALGYTSGFTGGSSQGKNKAGQGGGPGAYEMERKLELFEGLTGLVIVSYVETIRQPGDAKAVTYTCLLSVDNKEFPFKLTIWDEKIATEEDEEETEHVVYAPGEPLDPELELDYLRGTFTFPRSQMRVFYHNMMNILTDVAPDGDEEEEEEE